VGLFVMLIRTVCAATPGASLPAAIMRILPSCTRPRLIGTADQPASTWPDITWVRVAAAPPVDTSLTSMPAALASAAAIRLLDEPGREKPTVLPARSLKPRAALSARTYQ